MREIPAPPGLASAFALASVTPGAAHHAQLSLSLGEAVPSDQLRRAWDEVAKSHPLLSCAVVRKPDDTLTLREDEPLGFRWRELDWSKEDVTKIPSDWQSLQAAELLEPIALDTPSLVRAVSIDLPGGHTHLLLTFPSFLLDENALFVCIAQWLALLDGQPVPSAVPLPQVPPPEHSSLDWWHKHLSGVSAPLRLAVSAWSHAKTSSFGQLGRLLTRERSRHIADLAASLSISSTDLFRGIAALVLGRLAGSRDIFWLANGEYGLHLLPQHLLLDPSLSLETWLKHVSSSEQDRTQHLSVPLSRALSLLPPEKRVSPSLPAAFFVAPPLLNDRIHDAFPRWMNVDARLSFSPPAPLTVVLRQGGRFSLELHFDHASFSEAQAADILDRIERALDSAVADISRKLSAVDLLSAGEREAFTHPSSPLPHPSKHIEDRITETARRFSNDLAILGEGEAGLSFSEVLDHARSLAAYLRQENLADGWVVAVCLNPTPWIPVALLGVLLAGDTCIPIDPSSSASWLAEKIASCDAEIIICDSQSARLFEGSSRRILTIDRQWNDIAAAPATDARAISPKSAVLLAGTEADPAPPLAILSPALLAASCKESASRWRLKPSDRIPLLAPAGTGAFVETVLSSLSAGATILLPSSRSASPLDFPQPSHLRLSFFQWRQLVIDLQRKARTPPDSLRSVAIETSFVPPSLFALWQSLVPETLFTHVFWSPAGSLGLSLRFFHKGPVPHTPLPLGLPSPGLAISLQDACGEELPPGYIAQAGIRLTGENGATWPLRLWRDESGAFFPVSPCLEEETIRSLDDVIDAVIHTASTEGKTRQGAWIVTTSPLPPAVLENAVRTSLPASKTLDFILSVDHWPLTIAGNLDEKHLPLPVLARTANPAPAQPATPSAPRPRPVATAAPAAVPTRDWEPLKLLSSQSEAPILCLVHDMDGDPSRYETLARLIKEDWTVYGTVARGFVQPSACHHSLESEAAAFVEALCSLDPVGPYHLGGYGFGAILAYEMARQLRRTGKDVNYLALLGAAPPRVLGSKHWLRPLARLFRGSTKPAPVPDSPVAQAHAAALQEYQTDALEGPAGIVLGSDLGRDVENEWLVCAPDAFIERISTPSAQMLAEPSVKRLSVILSEWAEGTPDDA